MEGRGLRINMKKMKLIISGSGLDCLHDCGAFPFDSAGSQCIISAVASRADFLPTRTLSALDVMIRHAELMEDQSPSRSR